jgi:hypothetical protein
MAISFWRKLMKSIKLNCYTFFSDGPRIVPADANRVWMDKTSDRFAYRCTPLSMANASGWELLNPVGLTISWDGRDEKDAITVQADDNSDAHYAISHFGYGILTFQTAHIFQTDPEWVLWCRGSPNQIKDGIAPLDGIIETSWLPFAFTMNWRFTRPCSVRFEPGEPFCFFTLWPSVAVEHVVPRLMPLESNQELNVEYLAWRNGRDIFNAKLETGDRAANLQKWQRTYLHGRSATGNLGAHDHRIKRRLKEPVKDENLYRKYPPRTGFVTQKLDIDERTILIVASSMSKDHFEVSGSDGVYEGNETSDRVLSLCDGERNIGAVVDILLGEYEVDRERLLADVLALSKEFLKKRIAVPRPCPYPAAGGVRD